MRAIRISPEMWQEHLLDGFYWHPRCTRTTRRGRPCKNPIFGGQAYEWDEDDQPFMWARNWETFQEGACPFHRWSESR